MKVNKNKKGRKRCSDGFCDRCSSVGWVEVQQQNPNPCEHNSSSIVSTGKTMFWNDSSSSPAEKLSTCINSKSSLILKVKKKKVLSHDRVPCLFSVFIRIPQIICQDFLKLVFIENERADSTKKERNSLICMSWSKETEKQLNDVVYSKISAKTEHQSVQINR